MERYRIFCTENEATNLPATITVEEKYPAFLIVSAPAAAIAGIKNDYPVEAIPAPKPPPAFSTVADIATSAAQAKRRGPYVVAVRFRAPVRPPWLDDIRAISCQSLAAIGSSTLVVSCPNRAGLKKLQSHSAVSRVSTYVPNIRINPESIAQLGAQSDAAAVKRAAAKLAGQGAAKGPVARPLAGILTARFFTREDRDRAMRNLKRKGIRSINHAGDTDLIVDLSSSPNAVQHIQTTALLKGLRSLTENHIKKLCNNLARKVIGDRVVTANPDGQELTGSGEVVAVADSGLDTGDASTVHADFQGRIKDIQSFPIVPVWSSRLNNPQGDDGAADIYSGHGTHVCGSVLGDGSRAAALGLDPIQGTAPGAKLVFQAIEQTMDWNTQGVFFWLYYVGMQPPRSGLFGIPDDLGDLFQPAYDQGARIHSNSWGGGEPGVYDEQSQSLDQFVWDHPDFLVIVAAGNEGTDSNPQGGGVDPMSVNSPGTAKNCLTVGACENNRPDQFTTEVYGDWWPNDFPGDPYHSDSMTDSPDDIVPFSSRGPCTTGRRKPDLIAPGTFVLSTRSSQIPPNHFAWGAFPPAKQDYMYMGGTSMATPLVAGCAAVVRQYLRQTVTIDNPSAALMKAVLIHSTRYLQYRYSHPDSSPWADHEQGWGRVELEHGLNPKPPTNVLFFDETDGLSTGAMREFEIEVTDPSVNLRATMVYSDYPGEDLINNLNLIAVAPEGGGFVAGNDFSGTGSPDGENNVEGIVVQNPRPGIWALRVVASNVPEGPQGFALVVSAGGARSI